MKKLIPIIIMLAFLLISCKDGDRSIPESTTIAVSSTTVLQERTKAVTGTAAAANADTETTNGTEATVSETYSISEPIATEEINVDTTNNDKSVELPEK